MRWESLVDEPARIKMGFVALNIQLNPEQSVPNVEEIAVLKRNVILDFFAARSLWWGQCEN